MIAALITAIGDGAILALIAVGIVLVFKGSRVLNLAQGAVGLFALFVAYLVLGKDSANGVALVVVTVLLGLGMGIAIERVLIRPLVGRPPIQATIVTLGVAVVLINAELLNGTPRSPVNFIQPGQTFYPVRMPPPIGGGVRSIAGATISDARILALVLTAALGFGLYAFFTRTKFGLGVVAATSDDTVARLLGIPVRKVYRFTWGLGGALSGLSAVLVADFQTMTPGTMTLRMVTALAAAVIGGLDSIWGAILGGFLVGMFTGLVQFQTGDSGLANLSVLVLVVGTLMVRPRGLLGGAGADA